MAGFFLLGALLLCVSAYLCTVATRGRRWRLAVWIGLFLLFALGALFFVLPLVPHHSDQQESESLLPFIFLALVFWVPGAWVWLRLMLGNGGAPKLRAWLADRQQHKAAAARAKAAEAAVSQEVAALRRMGGAPERNPEHQVILAPDSAYVDVGDRLTLPMQVMFSYRDRDGQDTTRTVDVAAIGEANGETYLDGFCHKEQAERSFRTDRIQGTLMDADTGEFFAVSRLLADVPGRQLASFVTRDEWGGSARKPVAGGWGDRTTVLFTGFAREQREELEARAEAAGWVVRSKMGPTLDYLVCGPRAGGTKTREADVLLVQVIDVTSFEALLSMDGH